MKATERFLRQATRGLWGQKKRDALTELRGAVEDKVYRHRLGGMSEADATLAALRDLGSPHAIARDLNRVHSGPQIARMTLLVGLTGLLGWQALAQVQPVQTAYLPSDLERFCHVVTPAELQASPPALQQQYRERLAQAGGAQAYLQKCLNGELPIAGVPLLKVSDVLAALKAGGVQVGDQTDYTSATSTTPLIVYTGPNHTTPGKLYHTTDIRGERYIGTGDLLAFLTLATTQPLRLNLNGVRNPVLEVGQVKLQLGTVQVPVLKTNLVAGLILRDLGGLNLPRPGELVYGLDSDSLPPDAPYLAVPGQEGDLFAVIQNFERLQGSISEWLLVRARTKGTIPIGFFPVTPVPRVVTTLNELNAATARRENAVMVYRVNATDLRQVTLAQVPASQLHLTPAP